MALPGKHVNSVLFGGKHSKDWYSKMLTQSMNMNPYYFRPSKASIRITDNAKGIYITVSPTDCIYPGIRKRYVARYCRRRHLKEIVKELEISLLLGSVPEEFCASNDEPSPNELQKLIQKLEKFLMNSSTTRYEITEVS